MFYYFPSHLYIIYILNTYIHLYTIYLYIHTIYIYAYTLHKCARVHIHTWFNCPTQQIFCFKKLSGKPFIYNSSNNKILSEWLRHLWFTQISLFFYFFILIFAYLGVTANIYFVIFPFTPSYIKRFSSLFAGQHFLNCVHVSRTKEKNLVVSHE